MSTKYTITVHKGNFKNYNRSHNIRKKELINKEIAKDMRLYNEPHIDILQKGKNIILCDKDPRKMYSRIFDTPKANGKSIIEEWNEKQEKNRNYHLKYTNGKAYYEDLKKKAGKTNVAANPVVELIIQFGNYDERPDENIAEKLYRQFYKNFKEKYGEHFKPCGAYIHFDEVGGHHMHLDVIPLADREGSRGMLKKISFEIAAKQALSLPKDYKSKNAAEAPTFLFCERLRQDIAKLYEREGFSAERFVNQNAHHIATPQFKLLKRKETLERTIHDYISQIKELKHKIEHYKQIKNTQVNELINNKEILTNQKNLIIDINDTYEEVVNTKNQLVAMASDIIKNVEQIPELEKSVLEDKKQIMDIEVPSKKFIDNLLNEYEEITSAKKETR